MKCKIYNFLLQVKDVVIEEFMELLVGEVDAKLFKGVDLEFAKKIFSHKH